jgi:hypothetical protein
VFLLCARRVENPLRLLVLDDPLQNMDELTVTTIARGLTKILRLWTRHPLTPETDGPPWRLLLLVHGDEDMERIRQEVPCAAYFLPWLAPNSATIQSTPIRAEESFLASTLQPLAALISPAEELPAKNR